MYKNEYQGGPTVEIFSMQGKDPMSKWKISGGSSVKRDFEKEVKSFVCCLEGSTATSKLQLPKDGTRQSLYLTQRYLVVQVYIPQSKDFSIELSMTDTGHSKRRLVMSTSIRDFSITPLHAKLSLTIVKRDTWLNLCLDLSSILSDLFRKQSFKSLDSIILSGNCKVRRIFTMRNQPPDTTEFSLNAASEEGAGDLRQLQLENIPPSLQFANTVPYTTQVVTVSKIKDFLRPRDTSGYCSSSSDDLNNSWQNRQQHSSRLSARDNRQGPSHIAFGTRVRLDSTSSLQSGNKTSRSAKVSSRKQSTDSYGVTVGQNVRSNSGPTFKRPLNQSQTERHNANNNSNSLQVRNDAKQMASAAVPSPPQSAQSINIRSKQKFRRVKSPALQAKGTSILNSHISPHHSINSMPSSLVNLVDDMELSEDKAIEKENLPHVENDGVFMFSSRPHMVHRKVQEKAYIEVPMNYITNSSELEEDFIRSDASDSDEEIPKRIQRNTPSPLHKKTDATTGINLFSRSLVSPQLRTNEMSESIQINVDRVKSPSDALYNSKKYSTQPLHNSQDFRHLHSGDPMLDQSPAASTNIVNRSTASLRGSDATLTASVDTLVQNSMTKEKDTENTEDSLERLNPNSGTIPPSSALSPERRPGVEFELTSPLDGNTSHRSVTVSRKSLREIPQNSPRTTALSPRFSGHVPESNSFQVGSWSESFETHMLENMKREHEEEMLQEERRVTLNNQDSSLESPRHTGHVGNLAYEDSGSGDESFDTSWSTWKQPPAMQSQAYKTEMEDGAPVSKNMDTLAGSLGQSNPRDWAKLFSPPIVLPSERARQEKSVLSDVESADSTPAPDVLGISDGSSVSGRSTSLHESDEEEMLDLMYDPCLNCYFDPRTGRYYELKG